MATTTNYGWTTPDDTALVKDGASAIRALGTAIDTSMNTALGTKKSGLVLLNTTSFSAVASASLNNVFSSTYTNYLIIIYGTFATSTDFSNLRLRVGGVDNSTASSYSRQALTGSSTTTSAFSETNTSFRNAFRGSTNMGVSEILIFRPFTTSTTFFMSKTGEEGSVHLQSGYHNQTTSYDGFSIISNGNNFSATISTYGINS